MHRKTGAIRSSVRRYVAEMNVVVVNQVRRKASLTEMDLHGIRGDQSLKVSAEKPFHSAHLFDR